MVKLTFWDHVRLGLLGLWAMSFTRVGEQALASLDSKPWEAFSAIGTVAAVVVAISFGMREAVTKRADGVALAKLVAAILHPRISLCQTVVARVRDELREDPDRVFEFDFRNATYLRLSEVSALFTVDDVRPLLFAPHECAMCLANGLGDLEVLTRLFGMERSTEIVECVELGFAESAYGKFMFAGVICARPDRWDEIEDL